MNPVLNPFAPGAGSRPPALTGRDEILEQATIALQRVAAHRHAKSQMLLGLRGVGKTVLLTRIAEIAEDNTYITAVIEAPENRSLAELLVPKLRRILVTLNRNENARELARKAASALQSFASVFKINYGGLDLGVRPPDHAAATGDLETDLPDLILAVADAARAGASPVVILIDEVQYLKQSDLAALIVSLHRVAQKGLPLVFFGAGLPQLAGFAGEAKSYAERLFSFPIVGPLSPEAANKAVRDPVNAAGADISDKALQAIAARTKGYPYFLQEWAYHSWNTAPASPITDKDVRAATATAIEALDTSFFRVRLDRLTPREQDYLRAMATLGPGPHRSGDIAAALGIDVSIAAPLRTGLIHKGMIWSPAHGQTAFTVPMFDDFMVRAMPTWEPLPTRKRKRS
jgi:hypothetical protein